MTCKNKLIEAGFASVPRTCPECQLGPCKYRPVRDDAAIIKELVEVCNTLIESIEHGGIFQGAVIRNKAASDARKALKAIEK